VRPLDLVLRWISTTPTIIRGGENISSKEVEDVLAGHPAVAEVAVVGMADPVLGERVAAYVVLGGGIALELDEVREHFAAAGLARQKTPERLEVVAALPRTPAGKVQKYLLRERLRVPSEPESPRSSKSPAGERAAPSAAGSGGTAAGRGRSGGGLSSPERPPGWSTACTPVIRGDGGWVPACRPPSSRGKRCVIQLCLMSESSPSDPPASACS
jgi:hypothetical protein